MPVTRLHIHPHYVHPILPHPKIGAFTQYLRANNMADEVEAAVIRRARKTALKQKKARAQAKQMEAVDVALQTSLADT